MSMKEVFDLYVATISRVNRPGMVVFCENEDVLDGLKQLTGEKAGDVEHVKIDRYKAVLTQSNDCVCSVFGESAFREFFDGFLENEEARHTWTDRRLKELLL